MKNKTFFTLLLLSVFVLSVFSSGAVLYAQSSGGTVDSVEPSDVENLRATAGNKQIMLKWNAAKDNVGVTGYKIYQGTQSVTTSDLSYDLPVISLGNLTEYTVSALMNDKPYYFSVTALDAGGNESINYSLEATATPKATAAPAASSQRPASLEDNNKAPEVLEVKAKDGMHVTVKFSEPIFLPSQEAKSAFQIKKTSDSSKLAVSSAEIDVEDATGATVKLTTVQQQEDAEYELTAGIEILDAYNNPLVSGTSDTGVFKGKAGGALMAAEVAEDDHAAADSEVDSDSPRVSSVQADFSDRIAVYFSEPVVLPPNAKDNVMLYEKESQDGLSVKNVSASVDGKIVFITTAAQKGVEYEVQLQNFKDIAGNNLNDEDATQTVLGNGPAEPAAQSMKDLIPPEDVTELMAMLKKAETNVVELSWKASKNSAGDLADYLMYQGDGKDAKKFNPEQGVPIGMNTTKVDVKDLKPGKWYTFKIAAKDESGNESSGIMKSFFLPQTGPGILAAGLASVLGAWYRRRRKMKK